MRSDVVRLSTESILRPTTCVSKRLLLTEIGVRFAAGKVGYMRVVKSEIDDCLKKIWFSFHERLLVVYLVLFLTTLF